jgi:exopolysaccharide biosynthesis protein
VTNKKIVEVLQSRPRLLYNGKISSRTKNSAVTRRVNQPRTGIAFNKNTLFLLVVEGRSERSEGINLLEFAQFMKNLGAKEGLNLDGGGSSFFWFKGKLLNIPSGGWTPFTLPGMVRPIFNCLIVE